MGDESAPSEVLKLAEAARFIRVSEKTLGEMARAKRVPCQRAGREWRFLRSALEEWLKAGPSTPKVAEPLVAYRRQKLLFDSGERPAETTAGFGDTAFTRNRREPLHRWVPWIAGFSGAFVEEVLAARTSAPADQITVLDPFAGVGTTLIEGLFRGYNVVGFEINPYAALACRVKLQAGRCRLDLLEKSIRGLRESVAHLADSPTAQPRSVPPPGFRSNVPFFSAGIQRQVLFLLDHIETQEDPLVRDIMRVAFGSVMVSMSNYSYEPSLGTRVAAGKANVESADLAQVMTDKLCEMQADIEFLQRHLARLGRRPKAVIHARSYLAAYDLLPERSVDLLITSPPYLNNYHYIRNTRPHLFWLGLVKDRRQLREMEKHNFGQFWQTVRAGPPIELTVDSPELRRLLEQIGSRGPEKGVYGGSGWANYAATYFNDCDTFCRVTRSRIKPGGFAVVVIGNNILQGIEVRTDEVFADIARRNRFEVVALHRVRSKRTGSSIVDSSVRAGTMKKRAELYETAVELRVPS